MRSYTTAHIVSLLGREIAVLNIRAEREHKPGLANAAKTLHRFGSKLVGMDGTLKPVEVIAMLNALKGESEE